MQSEAVLTKPTPLLNKSYAFATNLRFATVTYKSFAFVRLRLQNRRFCKGFCKRSLQRRSVKCSCVRLTKATLLFKLVHADNTYGFVSKSSAAQLHGASKRFVKLHKSASAFVKATFGVQTLRFCKQTFGCLQTRRVCTQIEDLQAKLSKQVSNLQGCYLQGCLCQVRDCFLQAYLRKARLVAVKGLSKCAR